ncbi:hypothetical protein [Azospirillum endophyticum]
MGHVGCSISEIRTSGRVCDTGVDFLGKSRTGCFSGRWLVRALAVESVQRDRPQKPLKACRYRGRQHCRGWPIIGRLGCTHRRWRVSGLVLRKPHAKGWLLLENQPERLIPLAMTGLKV